MKNLAIYTLFLLAGVFSSCQDDEEFKIPTDVGFQMDINRNTSTNGRLKFSHGHISLAAFAFDGKREEGGDVYFTKSYNQGLRIDFDPKQAVDAFKFQIPQGNYTRIEVELDTYDDLIGKALTMSGTYLNSSGIQYPIFVEVSSSLEFDIISKDQAGNSQIILKAGTPATAVIKLDPVKWFATVPLSYLDNAVLKVEEGESEGEVETGSSYILISEDSNINIYNIIINRIEQSTETVFK